MLGPSFRPCPCFSNLAVRDCLAASSMAVERRSLEICRRVGSDKSPRHCVVCDLAEIDLAVVVWVTANKLEHALICMDIFKDIVTASVGGCVVGWVGCSGIPVSK